MNNAPRHLTHAGLRRHTQEKFIRNLACAIALLIVSMAAGIIGYHALAGMTWVDAFLNSAMLMGGMGPVETKLPNDTAKIFAGIYALYCGVVFIASAGLLVLPWANHVLHRFHLDHTPE